MSRVAVVHEQAQVRELYTAVLAGRGHGVLDLPTTAAAGSDLHACDVVVIHVPDGPAGLGQVLRVLEHTGASTTVAIDDDEPDRTRALEAAGVDEVLVGPVTLRALVETVDRHLQPRARRTGGELLLVQHDSAAATTRPGVRGTADRRGRHILLSAGSIDVAVHVFDRERGLRLRGDIAGAPEPVLAHVRLDQPTGRWATRTDASGTFELLAVAPGPTDLTVEGRGWSVAGHLDVGLS